ncbi:MAG TPA: phytoene/squalene synthase family protein [Pseudolabrys sp.]|nr:phytoene/squalene synthase family protein [Pseudolabrys sp.]
MGDHFKHCTALVREVDRDRYLATLFAPVDKRDALFALYAFDVEILRVRDLAREPMPGEIRLQWWREMLLGERATEAAANPVSAALSETLTRYDLSSERLIDLIEARRFDVYNEPMSGFEALRSYALRTEGSIFELAARILAGGIGSATPGLSATAGEAKTIANVLALLPHHAARRQLYVPLEVLRHYQADPDDIFAMRVTPELRAALAELRLRARRNLALIGSASADIPVVARPSFLPLAPLRRWLLELDRPDYDPFHPPHTTPWRKQWCIWRAAKSFRRIGA